MMSGTRVPTWRERENNKRRERRRRAIAAKIFTGLRTYGNYKLPKHCDNNEVLKALCNEAGWIVEPDGTTYRKGCKPSDRVDLVGGSGTLSPCSYHPTSISHNPSPGSSSFPSPLSSSYAATRQQLDGNALIPWLKNISSASSSASSSRFPHFYAPGGSKSAPVTPPFSSPSCQSPRNWQNQSFYLPWEGKNQSLLPSSTPPSPGRQILPHPQWFAALKVPQTGSTSPTISLVSSNPFGFGEAACLAAGGGSRIWTPGQSGTCSPAIAAGSDRTGNIAICQDEFTFRSNKAGPVKPWEGERIHEESATDDLELTLGSSKTR
ncbi:hypothetical protein SAY86_028514 [Trapa natans]|uniref:Protein BZR1 homolog n=1 Tax=Trapa natans TaxID=22666 RepID=A0AAN7RGG8_TRANT|nr:hypothetical protein SAY86_028514 [Trapa natans]